MTPNTKVLTLMINNRYFLKLGQQDDRAVILRAVDDTGITVEFEDGSMMQWFLPWSSIVFIDSHTWIRIRL